MSSWRNYEGKNANLKGGLFDARGPKALEERAGKRDNDNPEEILQATFFDWLRSHQTRHPVLRMVFSVPNSTFTPFESVRQTMIATGVRRGVWDVISIAPSFDRKYSGFIIEHKVGYNKLTEDQETWGTQAVIYAPDVKQLVSKSWITSANFVIEYFNLPIKFVPPERDLKALAKEKEKKK
jgi:hypothetical protein